MTKTTTRVALVLIPVIAFVGVVARWPSESKAIGEGLINGQWLASYSIASGSMRPTLEKGDYVYAVTSAFVDRLPVRGELAVYERDDGVSYVHRIVGLPGDRIGLRDGIVHLNGVPVLREQLGEYETSDDGSVFALYREHLPDGISHSIVEQANDTRYDNFGEVVVPPGHVFVLGDNRDNAADSRYTGPVSLARLHDKPMIIWWSGDRSRIGMSIQ